LCKSGRIKYCISGLCESVSGLHRNGICNVVVLFYIVNLNLGLFLSVYSQSFQRQEEQVVERDLMSVTSKYEHVVVKLQSNMPVSGFGAFRGHTRSPLASLNSSSSCIDHGALSLEHCVRGGGRALLGSLLCVGVLVHQSIVGCGQPLLSVTPFHSCEIFIEALVGILHNE